MQKMWKDRNLESFENKNTVVFGSARKINVNVYGIQEVFNCNLVDVNPSAFVIHWFCPPPDKLQLNTDNRWRNSVETTGFGGLFRDSKGR
ncbi:hypothetical protein U1Q18_039197 [Sarracenia purpurea var. burkii]